MANEENSDFSFGDFTFSSYPSNPSNLPNLPPISTTQTPDEEDDEWGDFVKTPFGSTDDAPPVQIPELDSQNESGKSGGSKSPFQKLKGPLPLSLFGDPEDDVIEETKYEDVVAKVDHNKVSPPSSSSVKKSGFNDILADLYNNNTNTTTTNNNNINNDNNNSSSNDKDNENSGNKSNGNKEVGGENGSSFDFYEKGSNLDSKDATLESFDVVSGLDGEKKSNENGEEKGKSNGSIEGASSNVDANGFLDFEFSGWGLESREPNGSIKRSSTNVDKNLVRSLDYNWWGLESRETSGGIKRSSTNVDENAVRGFDFSVWGLGGENNSMPSGADESKESKVENGGFSFDSNRLVSSAKASTSNTSDLGFDFGGWGLGSNGGSTGSGMLNMNADINNLIGSGGAGSNSNNAGLDENGNSGDISDEDDDDGWEFKGALSEDKGSHGIDITLNSNDSSNGFSPNKGTSLTSRNECLDGNNNNGNSHDDNKGREFQGKFPEENAGHTIDKVGPNTPEPSNTSTSSSGFINGSSNAVNLFAMSDGLNDLFPMEGGVSMQSSNLAKKSNSLAAPIHFTPDILFRSESSEGKAQLSCPDITIEDAETEDDDDDFGDFTAAFSETGPKREVNGGQHLDQNFQQDASISSSDIGSSRVIDLFSMPNGSTDLFSMVNAFNGTSVELQTDRDTLSSNAADISGLGPSFQSNSQESNRDGLNHRSVAESGEIEDHFGDFAAAFTDAGQVLKASDPSQSGDEESAALGKDLGTGSAAGNNTGALPLSLFGEEESEVDTNILKTYSHPVSQRCGQSPKPALSINDLISSLYSQADQSSPNKFVGATDSGAGPTIEINSKPVLDDNFNDNLWEFKDSFGIEGISKESLEVAACSVPSKVRVNGYLDFYSKLLDTLNFLIKCHLENIKKDGDDGKVISVDEEIQDELKEHVQEAVVTKEDGVEGKTSTDASLHDFIEALKDPKLQILEAEYDLSIKLSSAEKDLKSSLELTRHVKTMMNLLSLGSLEDRVLYVNLWSKMISICVQELQAGGNIWKQSLKRNVKNELMTEIRGKEFIKALGEIYRVAMVLDISARLYKPWILECSAESKHIFALLDECRRVWSTSGLEEALLDIFHLESINDSNVLPTLVESIQYIYNLEVPALNDHVFDWRESRCGLSLLTLDVIPESGMQTVVWDGKTYFVKLANLWANMISCDPPRVPPLHVVVDEKAG